MQDKKIRLDNTLVAQGLVSSRSQAESWIKLGKVRVDGKVVVKPGFFVQPSAKLALDAPEQYVSRAGLKLASVAKVLGVDFRGKVVLDVGSSTGGFTDYALKNGAKRVYAVDVGTDQLHPSLRGNERIELYEQTDIRDVVVGYSAPPFPQARSAQTASVLLRSGGKPESSENEAPSSRSGDRGSLVDTTHLANTPDIVVIDVSFISLREILPHIAKRLSDKNTQIVAMVKPQFEAGKHQVNKGVIKNDSIRRQILGDFEAWSRRYFIIQDKRDSDVAGSKGNRERFYLLRVLK